MAHCHLSSESPRLGDQIEEARVTMNFSKYRGMPDDLDNEVDMERLMGITR